MEDNRLVKIAINHVKGIPDGKFSAEQTSEMLRKELIELNGGKDHISRKTMSRGASNGLFALIEQVLDSTIIEGLQGNEFFNKFIEYRNIALGDKNEFVKEDNSLFVVADIARGNGGIQRQRIGAKTRVSIPTVPQGVRIYDELDRVLAGRIDFNEFVARVGKSFAMKILDDAYKAFSGIGSTQLGSTLYVSGTYDEGKLLTLVDHVEAKTGQKSTIVSTRNGLRKIMPSATFVGETIMDDMYNMGYVGKFAGTPTMRIEQRYKVGTETFLFPDDEIYVIAGDDKFIKHITEGESMIDYKSGLDNIADMTQEYMYIDINGTGILMNNSGIGKYKVS